MNRKILRAAHATLLGVTVLLAPAGCTPGFQEPPAKASRSSGEMLMALPNYQFSPHTPVFQDGEFGVKMSFENGGLAATFAADAPWIAYGAYRIDPRDLADLGPRPAAQIVLIAIHKETRAIFTGCAIKDDQGGKEPPPDNAPTAVIAVKSCFNVDLKQQCRIKPAPGRYWAVAVIGRYASPVLEITVK